jgi:hypothetical protein
VARPADQVAESRIRDWLIGVQSPPAMYARHMVDGPQLKRDGVPPRNETKAVAWTELRHSGPSTVWSLLCVAETRATRPNGEWGYRDLVQDFQEQKRSSAALVPLEIPRKPWPCAFLMLPALLGCLCAAAGRRCPTTST